MYYVYVLKNPKNEAIYIGFSADLQQPIRQHKANEHRGWELAYYEAYRDESEARLRERKLTAVRCGARTSESTYPKESGFTGVRKSGVMACLLHNESASYCQWQG